MTENFYRNKKEGMIGGVCAGLAEYFNVSPILLRLVFILCALATGFGMLIYLILWIILPEKESFSRPREERLRYNVNEIRSEVQELSRDLQYIFSGKALVRSSQTNRLILLGGLLVLMGLVLLADNFHLFGWFHLRQLWPIILILVGFILLSRALRH